MPTEFLKSQRGPACRAVLAAVMAVAGAASTGCGRSRSDLAKGEPAPTVEDAESSETQIEIEVIDNAYQVASARRAAVTEQPDLVSQALLNLAEADLGDPELIAAFRQRKDEVLPTLKGIVAYDSNDKSRLAAVLLLCHLKDPAGTVGLVTLLRTGDAALRTDLLNQLALAESLHGLPADRRLHALLLAQLDERDEKLRAAAIEACAALKVPDTVPKLLSLLRASSTAPKGRICYQLTALQPSAESLELSGKLLVDPQRTEEPLDFVMALSHFTDSGEAPLAARALVFLAEFVRAEKEASYPRRLAFEEIALYGGPEYLPLLHQIFEDQTEAESGLRQPALEGLARIEGPAAMELHLLSLKEADLKATAATGIGRLGRGKQDPELIRALRRAAIAERNFYTLGRICDALLEIGGPAAAKSVAALADRLHSGDRQRVLWKVNGQTLDGAVNRLVALDLLPKIDLEQTLARVREKSGEEPGSELAVEVALVGVLADAGVLLTFPAEEDSVPCRHDLLIRQFAACSRGRFVPEAISQKEHVGRDESLVSAYIDEPESDFVVQFIHHARLYRFHARNYEDWYDVASVVAAINRALSDAQLPQRFVSLSTHDDTEAFWFGEPSVIQQAAKELHLTLP